MSRMGGGAGEGRHDRTGEDAFIDGIDCQFPYFDRERALGLAAQALSISTNAAFAVVCEVCYVPGDAPSDIGTRRDVLARIERQLPHPLGKVILPIARDLIEGRRPKTAERIAAMRKVAPFPHQYAALQIVLFAQDPDEPLDDEPDRVYDEIVASWNR